MDIIGTVIELVDLPKTAGLFDITLGNLILLVLAGYIIGLSCLTVTYSIYFKNKAWSQLAFLEKSVLSFVVGALMMVVSTLFFAIANLTVWEDINRIIPFFIFVGPIILFITIFKYNPDLIPNQLDFLKKIIHVTLSLIFFLLAALLFIMFIFGQAYMALFSTLAIAVIVYIAIQIHTHIVK